MQQKQEQRTGPLPPKSSRLLVDPEPPHPASPPHTHETGEDDVHVNPADPDDAGGQ